MDRPWRHGEGIDPDAPCERLFPAVLAAARRLPTLLVVEDVHWADHATLDLLKYLSRRIARTPLLLALSYRDDEIGPDHPLITLLGEAGTTLRRIALGPLSREAVERLASGRAGVFELTGGNPFYVTEVLASELAGVPPMVRDAVLARAAKLTSEARQVLEMASLIPGGAELGLLDAADEAIEGAAHGGIVRIESGAIVFRHELARRAIEESLAQSVEATAIRASLGDTRQEGDNLRWQSRFNWFLGRNAEARRTAAEAIAILQEHPGRELAMAYSNRSQLHFLAEENDLAIEWGMRAIELATNLGDHEILAHALNNVGSAAVMANDLNGFEGLEESLRLSLECGYPEHAARAYVNIFTQAVRLRQYPRAERFVAEGIDYCQERDLRSYEIYLFAWRARLHLERGRWDAAADDAQSVLAGHSISPINRIPALLVLGTVRARRGDPGGQALLDEAHHLAQPTRETQRIAPVALARAEAAWLRGDLPSAAEDLRDALALADRIGEPIERNALELWLWRVGGRDSAPPARPPTGDPYDSGCAFIR